MSVLFPNMRLRAQPEKPRLPAITSMFGFAKKRREEQSPGPQAASDWARLKVLELEDLPSLLQALGWTKRPVLEGFPHLHQFQHLTDINQRRLRDAEVIAAACCNAGHHDILEIGTSSGQTTAIMALNAPGATIHTINIPPDEIDEGGKLVTYAPALAQIGSYYRERGCKNVRQILANTAKWQPDIPRIDVAFVDGCHDAGFVYNDTAKILPFCPKGSIVLWHDFNPALIPVHDWIADVCRGVARLYASHLIDAPILHLKHSWVGLYRVGGYEDIHAA